MKVNLTIIANLPIPARLLIFILVLLFLWLPLAIPISLIFTGDPNLVSILTMGLVGLEFLALLKLWSKYVDKIPQGFQYYGLERSSRNAIHLVNGLSIGLNFAFGLFFVESLCGWLEVKNPTWNLLIIIGQGLLCGCAVAFFEELFFRGWLLKELELDYSPVTALWISAFIFAFLHFIKPLAAVMKTLPQFPALMLLGATLVWAKRICRGRLGLSIGLHAGLIWGYYILNVGGLLSYRPNVPDWVTGINRNPLQGIMGLLFLSILAWEMRRRAR